MPNLLRLKGMQISAATIKKLLTAFLLVIGLISLTSSYWLERRQEVVAAELQQKASQTKNWYEAIIGARAALDGMHSFNPEAFAKLNKAYKQLDKTVGADKLDPALEKMLGDKTLSDQHMRVRAIAVRDALKQLLSLEKPLNTFNSGVDLFQAASSAKGVVNPDRISSASPFHKTAELLKSIPEASDAWQANFQNVEAFNSLQANLTELIAEKEKLDAIAASNKFNPLQEKIYSILKKISLWNKTAESQDVLNQFNNARKRVIDLTKDKDAMNDLINSYSAEPGQDGSRFLIQATQFLTFISIICALVLIFVLDMRARYGDISGEDLDVSQVDSLREAHDILPYTQIALGQISDLGSKVLNATKRFHTLLSSENATGRKKIAESAEGGKVADYELSHMRSEIVALREQALQLSLANSGGQLQLNLSELSMRLNSIVETLDNSLAQLEGSINHAFAQKQNMEIQSLQKMTMESEGLILALSQLERQIDRMEGVLEEMGVALEGAIHGVSPRDRGALDTSADA